MPGKKKKKGGEKGNKESEETITLKEAIMMHQIEVKQSQLKELKQTLEECTVQNENQKAKNAFLKKEQNLHLKDIISEIRGQEKENKKKAQVPYEDVEKALNEKRKAIMEEQATLESLQQQVKMINETIQIKFKVLNELINYKEYGKNADETHVKLLEKDITDMEESYSDMACFFEKSLESVKNAIEKENENNIAKEKKLASECIIEKLDKHIEQEFLDNRWLRKEVTINRHFVAAAEKEVEMLEKLNIELMSYLFEQQLQDANETRKFYLACKEDELKFLDDEGEIEHNDGVSADVLNLEEIIEEDGNAHSEEQLPDDQTWIEAYLPELEQLPTEDDYRLGPMEVRLIYVAGKKAVLHECNDDLGSSSSNKEQYKKIIC